MNAKIDLKRTVFIIKSSPWKTAYKSKNHPEYSAILDLVHRYGSEMHFILLGTSSTRTSGARLKNGSITWDIKTTGGLSSFTYYFDLMKLLFKYRPHLVIVLGLLNILPVAIYSLLSPKSRYVPVFIGEFGYYGTSKVNQFLMSFGLKLLGRFLQLSKKKILNMFTLSRYTQRRIEKLAPDLSGKIKLISYPISPSLSLDQQSSVSKHSEEPIILTVAGIEPRKGIDILLKAASLLQRKFRIIIKGSIRDSSYMKKLTAMVKSLDIENRVTFITDIVDYNALIFYYRSATMFVFPTRDDCLGVVILEALHCGLPVIATSVGGIPDMIENGANGILVKADNPHELASAISLLLDDAALRRKLSVNARPVLISRYYHDRTTLQEALTQSISALGVERQRLLHQKANRTRYK
jgi:glycosyltransferase involved in cell wall biosynthesis